jgi:phosphatidate cytidylyltransferase
MERIVPGLLIAGSWLLLLWLGSIPFFNLIIFLLVMVAADEYLKMADSPNLSLPRRLLLALILTLPVIATALEPDPAVLAPAVIVSFGALCCYFFSNYKKISDSYGLFSRLVFGLLYIGLLGAHFCLLRALPEGTVWLLIASAITASSDSGAYFIGKRFGKRKLCANISPNKTVEGAAGGIVSGLLAAIIIGSLLLERFDVWFIAVAAVFLCLIGIAGDLTESIIKRGTGTKDSGSCLAGHGGVLDRVDSLLFVCPVLYYLLVFPVS